jgi:hypothetical protein
VRDSHGNVVCRIMLHPQAPKDRPLEMAHVWQHHAARRLTQLSQQRMGRQNQVNRAAAIIDWHG